MSFQEHLERDRRLVILRGLHNQVGYTLNESVIQIVLDELGHGVSRDRVRSDLEWLAEQGLCTISRVAEGRVMVACLTQLGADVATGRARNPGVKLPSPKG